MKQVVNVVMLPTKDTSSRLVVDENSQQLRLLADGKEAAWGHQHIYFVIPFESRNSLSKLEEGDYVLHHGLCKIEDDFWRKGNVLQKVLRISGLKVETSETHRHIDWTPPGQLAKVVATTDPSLTMFKAHMDCNGLGCDGCLKYPFTKIPLDWIENIFIPSNGKINKVNIECITLGQIVKSCLVKTDENNNCVISYEEDPYENDAEYKALRQKAQNEVIRRATERTYTKKDIDLAIQAAHKALRIEKTNDDGDFVSIEYIYRFLDIERQDYLYHTEEELEKIALKCYEEGFSNNMWNKTKNWAKEQFEGWWKYQNLI